jgi:hypothetical protein
MLISYILYNDGKEQMLLLERNEYFILINSKLSSHLWLVTTLLDNAESYSHKVEV